MEFAVYSMPPYNTLLDIALRVSKGKSEQIYIAWVGEHQRSLLGFSPTEMPNAIYMHALYLTPTLPFDSIRVNHNVSL